MVCQALKCSHINLQTIRLENLDIYSIRIVVRYYLFTIVTIIIIKNATKLYYIYD